MILDADLRVSGRIPSVDGWIQDALRLEPDCWLVADVSNFRLVAQDSAGRLIREVPYDDNWRVFAMEVVPLPVARALLAGAASTAARRHQTVLSGQV